MEDQQVVQREDFACNQTPIGRLFTGTAVRRSATFSQR
jgi:hypothetical protein